MTTLGKLKALLMRCLASRLSATLRSDIETALSAKPGAKSVVDPDEVVRLSETMTDAQVAEHLGCGTATVTRAKRRARDGR